MGFWKKIFQRKKKQEIPEDNWENIVYARDDVDFSKEEQRSRYITGCLEQMAEAAKELKLLTGEYSLVTAYLTDTEEIDALPEEEREELNVTARKLLALEEEREKYRTRQNRMADEDYYRIRKQENQVQEGIQKLSEGENYRELIKQDLKKLDRERHAYEYRRLELENMMGNFRGMAVIFLTAFGVCLILLLLLQFGFRMNTRAGYLLAAGAVTLAVTVLVVKYTDCDRELQRVENGINKLILLQNKVKIRYVNNRNLLEYLYIKYETQSAEGLRKLWQQYQQEKEERKQYAEAEGKLDYYQRELVSRMRNFHITDPERWTSQPGALLDKREMVEIRHELILRRQSLRKQMDYNNGVADTARKEIMEVVKRYPVYAEEIMGMVERFDSSIDL